MSRTASISALCLSLLSAQVALGEVATCDTSTKDQPGAAAQPCANRTERPIPAEGPSPSASVSPLKAAAISMLADRTYSPNPSLAPHGDRTADGQALSGYSRQSGVAGPARRHGFRNAPDAASDVNGSWAAASAENEANMAAADRAFQQAQQDAANSIATAMEAAQKSVNAAMSTTGSAKD